MSSPPAIPRPPTGAQWMIGHGRQQLVVTEVGATMRAYTVDGRDVLDGFAVGEWSHGGRGQVLAPWPNRLGDGRYEFAGRRAQAPLDEPARGNALHGLVRWLPWRLEAQAQNVVALGCVLHPSPGYPFCVSLRIEYRLGREGLSVATVAHNEGDVMAPFGLGFHPYLTVGTASVDTSLLRLPATRRLVLDNRALPTGEVHAVAGTEYDFTATRAVGPTRLDTAFTGLERDEDGLAWASVEEPGGARKISLWVDEHFDYLMCFTGDSLDDETRRRTSVAIEPMTCPPDAFRTHDALVALEPGQTWQATWGLRPS